MSNAGIRLLVLTLTGCALLCGGRDLTGQTPQPARLAKPRRILAGDELLGAGRLFPSPVLHDVNGDGLADIVIGDLPGRVTFAPRTSDEGAVAFGAEQPLLDRDGTPLKFHNW